MSKGRKSEYPERPVRRKHARGSEKGGGKRRSWLENVPASKGARVKEKDATLNIHQCVFGHSNPALSAFLFTTRFFRVPLHVWGKKGRA